MKYKLVSNNQLPYSIRLKVADFILHSNRLTMGEKTKEFESLYSQKQKCKYSIFVNSGSSANFLMISTLIESGRLKNNKVLVPSLSWATSVSPLMMLKDVNPILIDTHKNSVALNLDHLEHLLIKENPACLLMVHPLGIFSNMDIIKDLCDKHDCIIIEDSCESMFSKYHDGTLAGNFGEMSTFSFYWGHLTTTIEGGLLCTNDEELYNIALSIRSHGWLRDCDDNYITKLKTEHNVSDFNQQFTFYHSGYNIRPNEINSLIGIYQLQGIDRICKQRNDNYKTYCNELGIDYGFLNVNCVNFAFPYICNSSNHRNELVKQLEKNQIETRPLIAGSIEKHPFYYQKFGKTGICSNSEKLHENGIYLPNNQDLNSSDVKFISSIVNNI